jgi:hypothetical protein
MTKAPAQAGAFLLPIRIRSKMLITMLDTRLRKVLLATNPITLIYALCELVWLPVDVYVMWRYPLRNVA